MSEKKNVREAGETILKMYDAFIKEASMEIAAWMKRRAELQESASGIRTLIQKELTPAGKCPRG